MPQKLVKWEREIVENYRKEFYFRKIETANGYNKKLGLPMDTQPIEDLKVQVIYVENNQSYFSFNSVAGNFENQIIDPIALIYNGVFDNSSIGALVTSSLFFLNESKGNAYNIIKPIVINTYMGEVESVKSVYGEANSQIVALQWKVLQQALGLSIIVIFFLVFLAIVTWCYYQSNQYKIMLKQLFGYSYVKRNKGVILLIVLTDVSAGCLFSIIYSSKVLLLFIVIFVVMDLIIMKCVGDFTNSKVSVKSLKRVEV